MYLPNWCANLMRGTNLEDVFLVPLLDWPGIPATLTAPWHELEHWRTGRFFVRNESCRKICIFDHFWDTLRRWLETLGPWSPLTHTTLNVHAVTELNLVFVLYYKNNLLVDIKRSSIAGGLFE